MLRSIRDMQQAKREVRNMVTEAKNLTEANPLTPALYIMANIISSLHIVFISLYQFYY